MIRAVHKEPRRETWAIVGGGLLGLTCALRLAQAGHSATVYEAGESLGGLAGSRKIGDTHWDRYYHVILKSDRYLRGLLGELDLDRTIHWQITKAGCYWNGRPYSISNSVELLRFPALSFLDKMRLAITTQRASAIKRGEQLEGISVEAWLRRWGGDRAFENFWRPLLRSKLGGSYHRTSAAFIWATIRRLNAARRSGLKREMFGNVDGGYSRILEALSRRLQEIGAELLAESPVAQVGLHDNVVQISESSGQNRVFDRAIITLAPPIAARLCPQLTTPERHRLTKIEYLGIICASMLTDFSFGGFYVTNLLDETAPFTGLIEMTALVDRVRFGDRSLVYLPRYVSQENPLLQETDEAIKVMFLSALERMYPGFHRRSVEDFRISRSRFVFPLPVLGYSALVPTVETSIPGVYLLNSAQIVNGTLNVNETVQLAETGIDSLLARTQPSA